MSGKLPDYWQAFLNNLHLPPGLPQTGFEYGLALLLVESGEAAVTGRDAAGAPALCRAADGCDFSLTRPDLDPTQETMLLAHLRWLLSSGSTGR
jgi:hypothetical protein